MLDSDYRTVTEDLYAEAAQEPQPALCCTTTPTWKLPGLNVPKEMLERNYGCGTTVNPIDLANAERVLYVGVGAGMEALQLSYFLRKPGGVLAIDKVPEMLAMADTLLTRAAADNDWFDRSFVDLQEGDALSLPASDASVDVVAQNCLFNIFNAEHLATALTEVHRVLKPGGRFVFSDPVAERQMPSALADDPRLRAQCLSGALTLPRYLETIVEAGFGTLEVRSRRPYRVLDPERYDLDTPLMLESVEAVAIKDPIPKDGPCIFTGRTAIYIGRDAHFDDGKGHLISRDLPLGVCDKTAAALQSLERHDLIVTEPTWHYPGDGCC
ncbi:MAG: arsenosugar biosynthesis arsenite methyltransferase ArsM [Polyangiales bacterium]